MTIVERVLRPLAAPRSPEGSFDEFVAAHWNGLTRTAYLLTGELRTAERSVEKALVRAHRVWHRPEVQADPLTFVRAMIVRRLEAGWLDERRSSGGQQLVELIGSPDHDQTAPATDDVTRAWIALQQLEPCERAAVVLRYIEGVSEAEVSRLLGRSVDTVQTSSSRGRAHLEATLCPDGPAPR